MVGASARPAVRRHDRRAAGRSSDRRRPRRRRSTSPVDPECVAALTVAAELLAELGHEVREETPPWREPDLFDKFIAVWQVGPALHPVDER